MAAKACPLALSSECGQRAVRGPRRTEAKQRGPKRFNFLRDRSPGVGARGRSPRESADPQVRRAGSWSKQGGRKLRKQYRGGGGLGFPCGGGPKPCTAEMHGILHMADLSGQGRGTGGPGSLLGAPRAPQRHFRSPKLVTAPTTARFSEFPTTRFDDIVSLRSAAVGAALSNPPTPLGVPASGSQ